MRADDVYNRSREGDEVGRYLISASVWLAGASLDVAALGNAIHFRQPACLRCRLL